MNCRTNPGNPVDLSEIRFLERIVIGKCNDRGVEDEAQRQQQLNKLNACLNGTPRGIIVGKDCSFQLIRIGEHTVVTQQVAYHIGFKRKPSWR
ncbi:hypothetical protein VA7868_04562 [Vibrio aerogenes CECT 7868]|uniref:Uncharacterized protein n=1 Tax=Vibrio aerogenes CECT 7868 TaxID=1216006 RepID=A0A1M6F0Y2_9VIBR|nr:hypothetical protein [Vibrio aerogenes]SHI19739.1 hypothetical protein VA7868_02342 [Vibrio aerogenes CECT 7868]SHI91388.1 hypothetical protein VA7868_04562 [Vibrio aerogenes CECT 7868]